MFSSSQDCTETPNQISAIHKNESRDDEQMRERARGRDRKQRYDRYNRPIKPEPYGICPINYEENTRFAPNRKRYRVDRENEERRRDDDSVDLLTKHGIFFNQELPRKCY